MKNKSLKQVIEIEQHPAWQGKLLLEEISILLVDQHPFTYMLSEFANLEYLLSYVTKSSQGINHISFRTLVVIQNNQPKLGYRNGTNIIFSTLDAFIRYKLKGRGLPLRSLPLILSA